MQFLVANIGGCEAFLRFKPTAADLLSASELCELTKAFVEGAPVGGLVTNIEARSSGESQCGPSSLKERPCSERARCMSQ